MFLNLNELSLDELYEKSNELHKRMAYVTQFGGHNSYVYNQCVNWLQHIELEIQERMIMENFDFESGTVTIIGEATEEPKKKG